MNRSIGKKAVAAGVILSMMISFTGCNKKQPDLQSEGTEVQNDSTMTETISESGHVTEEKTGDAGFDADGLETEYNECVSAFVAEQQELYKDREYLTQSVEVSVEPENSDMPQVVYCFAAPGIEMTLTYSDEVYYRYDIEANGKELSFDADGWTGRTTPDYVDAYMYDMTGDGQNELVIVYTHRSIDANDSGIDVKVVDIGNMTLMDTENSGDTEFTDKVMLQIQARRDRDELDKKISVRLNELKEKYASEHNVKAYIYIKNDEPDSVYIIPMKDNEPYKAMRIDEKDKTSYLEKEEASEILNNAEYKLAGVRIISK